MTQLLVKASTICCFIFLSASALSAQVKIKISPAIKQEVQADGSVILRAAKDMKVVIEGQKEAIIIGSIATLSCSCNDANTGTCSRTDVGCIGTCCGAVIGYHDSMLRVNSGGIIITPDDVNVKNK